MEYQNLDDLENSPFSIEELTLLLNVPVKKIAKDKEMVEHILKRSLATAITLKNVRFEFDNELRRRSSMLPSTGGATTMANPELAVKYLPPEELAKLFDKFSQEKLEYLNSSIEKSRHEYERSRRVLEEVTLVATLPQTPVEIKELLIKILKESKDSTL
jgi:hypothetical protein